MRRFSLIGILTFLGLFVYFYKTSGKFRKSIMSALVAAFVFASGPLESEAKGADAFTCQPETTRASRNRDLFSSVARKPSNGGPGKPDNSGSGGDDDNGMPQYPKAESVQERENRFNNIDKSIARMEESSDSEEEECEATEHSIREIIAHDGVKGRLTDKSANHLTSKHAHDLGIDDPLPPSLNQKPGKFTQIRTRINKENKKQFTGTLEKILQDPNTEVFPGVSISGIKGHGYYTEDYGQSGFFIGIHTEGEFAGQIMRAQPVTPEQLEKLQTLNSIN